MPRARVWPFTGFQGVGATLLSRVLHNGVPITQAGISGIQAVVKQFNNGSAVETMAKTSLTVSQVVFDTLQTDARWTQDRDGYNVAVSLPASAFPEADEYWAALVFTPTSGSAFLQLARGTIITNVGALP